MIEPWILTFIKGLCAYGWIMLWSASGYQIYKKKKRSALALFFMGLILACGVFIQLKQRL